METLIKNLTDNEPDFINDDGVKWWKHDSITRWAHNENSQGISLPNLYGFITETVAGIKSFVLVDYSTNRVVYSSQLLEDVACHIDMVKTVKLFDEGVI